MQKATGMRLQVDSNNASVVPLGERLRRLHDLDLSLIKRKLMEPYPEGRGWTIQQCDEAETWYKRFLTLIIRKGDGTKVPNGPIDAFWHQHILDTRKYAEDTQYVLGYFLHHYPYLGMNDDVDGWHSSYQETNQDYRELFGADCTEMDHFPTASPNSSDRILVSTCGSGNGGSHCGRVATA